MKGEEIEELEDAEISHAEAQVCLSKLRNYAVSKCPQIVNDVLNLQGRFESLKLDRQNV